MRTLLPAAVVSLMLGACVSTPDFDKMSGITPQSIIDHVECELIHAKSTHRELQHWVAVAELSLQVDEQLALAPAFTHTDVVSREFSRILDWGVKFDTQAQRAYSQSITFNIDALGGGCDRERGLVSLDGDLGLEEVVGMAFASVDPVGDNGIGMSVRSEEEWGGGPSPRASRAGPGGGGKKSAFGTSLEFVVRKNVGPSGPTWSLAYFKGPGKLFTAQRNDTHKLTISFAKTEGDAKLNNLLLYQQSLPTTLINRLQMQLE